MSLPLQSRDDQMNWGLILTRPAFPANRRITLTRHEAFLVFVKLQLQELRFDTQIKVSPRGDFMQGTLTESIKIGS